MRLKQYLAVVVASLAVLLLGSHTANAASASWIGSTGAWSDSSKWSAGGPPNSSTDVATFPDPGSMAIVTVGSSFSVKDLSFPGGLSNYIFTGSGPLRIYHAITCGGIQSSDLSVPVVFESDVTFTGPTGCFVNFGGGIFGTGGFTLNAPGGRILLNAGTSYTGTTTITHGEYDVANHDMLPHNSAFVLADNSDAIFNVDETHGTILNLSGGAASQIYLNGGLLTFGDSNDTTYAGTISDHGFSGGGLVKQGSGKFTLTGASTYTGPTTVNAGTLDVNGSIAGSGVTVAAGATLKGSGTLPAVTLNGVVAPGNSIGTLNGTDFTFGSGSTLENEINAAGLTDLVNASSSVTINPGSTLKIIPAVGTYTPGHTYTIINAPSVSGTFSSVIDTSGLLNYQVKYYATHVDIVITAPTAVTSSTAAAPTTGFGTPANKPWLAEVVALISVATLATGLTLRYSKI